MLLHVPFINLGGRPYSNNNNMFEQMLIGRFTKIRVIFFNVIVDGKVG